MKELNDKDFDQVFKAKITEELPEFEEASWLKMEKKLKRREKLVFLKYASILLFLLAFGLTFYLLQKKDVKDNALVQQPKENKIENNKEQDLNNSNPAAIAQHNGNLNQGLHSTSPTIHQFISPKSNTEGSFIAVNPSIKENKATQQVTNNVLIIPDKAVPAEAANSPSPNVIAATTPDKNTIQVPSTTEDKQQRRQKKLPIALAIIAGPDFSSTNSLIGGKTGLTIGVGLGIGLTKKLGIKTGLSYGSKNYVSSAYDYTFSNPTANKAIFSQINAACQVIEIPLKASYQISENEHRSIELNAGLSSYLMVKENYIFKYNKELNRADRINNVSNANQHYLSVVELSGTYNIKLSNKKFALGIEPYVKIPLTGIGEGSVPLKSSGVSLKLSYDFSKK